MFQAAWAALTFWKAVVRVKGGRRVDIVRVEERDEEGRTGWMGVL